MKLVEAIGKRVENLLKERGISQYYLFKNGGVPRTTINDIVNVRKKNELARILFIKFVQH